ncbi:MAG: alanine--tRNA ligase [Candidatus Levybacteria bacterium]|nr:alanine--tRNA ligase [Candidatus Levybacteria bacterium]
MLPAREIIEKYVSFFEKRDHKRIANAPLVPVNDPSTLFTSSGMQPLVPYLLGQPHPQGSRLVNVQNCFRAQDIDEVGDNRHTTFFRMLGNWSLGDYFKKEQISWMWKFVTKELQISKNKLYVTVFEGNKDIPRDEEAAGAWKEILKDEGLNPDERIFYYGVEKNWWSRSGLPDNMPVGEPGGPDTEIFYDFGTTHDKKFGETCHVNCECGRYLEICNGVFMQYKKTASGFEELPKKNVDFGGGLERFLSAIENQSDVFQTSLYAPIIEAIETVTYEKYNNYKKEMRIIADHLTAAVFITQGGVAPSNKEQGYILRRLIRRSLDNINLIRGIENLTVLVRKVIEAIITQHKKTDPFLEDRSEHILNIILQELNDYRITINKAKGFVEKKYNIGDDLKGTAEISSDDAFFLYTSHGLSPTQIKSLGYVFDDSAFAGKMEEHQKLSRGGAEKKFRGGLADHEERTIMGHTATHLLHQALRDVLGNHVHQTGSNITTERVRFDFAYDKKLTDEEVKKVEHIVNEKIKENLPVHFELIPTEEAHKMGAIGLFMDTYGEKSKIYFIGPEGVKGQSHRDKPYSVEFCGGPHVDFTGVLKSFKIQKQENLGKNQKRIYAVLG